MLITYPPLYTHLNSCCAQVESSQVHNGSIQCECHVKIEDKTARRAKIKLALACVVALLFMIGEALGKGSSYISAKYKMGGKAGEVWGRESAG